VSDKPQVNQRFQAAGRLDERDAPAGSGGSGPKTILTWQGA